MRAKAVTVSYGWVIDKVWGQDSWILAEFFFFACFVFMNQDTVENQKLATKELGQYPAILTEQAWSIKDFSYGFLGKSFLQDMVGSRKWAR